MSPGLQGRIFCQLDGQLVHRLDASALTSPSKSEFNNVGGNSLWPAPEGGPFAFNYLPGDDRWLVQPGINRTPAAVVSADRHSACIEKRIELTNRRGFTIALAWRRIVYLTDAPAAPEPYCPASIAYRTKDVLEPLGVYRQEDVLVAPWSLEQFPGADGVIAFGSVQKPDDAINFDFYGQPGGRIAYCGDGFTFALGGDDRHQIGLSAASSPQCIGAIDFRRSLLILRRTPKMDGVYFNIADNDQPEGPFSAGDMYSIFNGGALGFYELETIAAMQTSHGVVAASTLESETVIYKADAGALRGIAMEVAGIPLASS